MELPKKLECDDGHSDKYSILKCGEFSLYLAKPFATEIMHRWNSRDDLLAACEDVQLELDLLLRLAKLESFDKLRNVKMAAVEKRIKQVKAAIAATH